MIEERVAAAVRETWIDPVLAAPSAREGVRAVFEAVAEELEQQGYVRGCPLNNLAHELSLADDEFRLALARIFADWRQAIADKIRADQLDGGEGAIDPERFCGADRGGLFRRHVDGQDIAGRRSVAGVFEGVRKFRAIAIAGQVEAAASRVATAQDRIMPAGEEA
ncbi:TetR family transcriptional regulator C-terminal domain-containing protein [Mesorhizobium argentiipisi]|uniref:LmrA/YxaF family transcription factor n=1 Tax=Mesorhizobium argentiipisi TaxID=3015175 RepID=UPI00301B9F4A